NFIIPTRFPQGQKTKNRNLKFVIPAKAGIQFVEFQLFRINFETLIPSFPRKWESGTQNLKKPFYPISFRTDKAGFPPARKFPKPSFWPKVKNQPLPSIT
ncbi:TPA: hypothetical protein ACFJKM_002139, partial [Neisseria gonorrhoeae]